MTTYVYETIPRIPGVQPRRFEVRQSMKDAPLAADPETGEPVRRVITGGYGLIAQKSSAAPAATVAAGCAPGCACHRN
jgi:predicted nucleic acid-binding Zn ribbon protein